MRSLLLRLVFFGLLPFVLRRPFLGVLVYFWISLMNPQQYAYVTPLPYAFIVGVVTLLGLMFSKEPKLPPLNATSVLIYLLMVWLTATSALALAPASDVWDRWELCEKMLLFTVLAYALTNTRERLDQLIAVSALSIGFIGFIGGIFTISHGGAYRVYGPNGSTIGDNNDFGDALVTMLPLLFYLFQRARQQYFKWPLLATIVLNFIASLFTYSRGALLALVVMGATLWFRARWAHKMVFAVLFAVAVAGVLEYAPPAWMDRMSTIKTYQDDTSAESRLYFWRLAWALAERRPIFGGGYHWMFYPTIVNSNLAGSGLPALPVGRATHSIWFQMLGDHGFVGLFLLIAIFVTGLLNAAWIVRKSKGIPTLQWANDLGRALQASIIGFAVGGSFGSLEMWDGFYVIIIIAAAARVITAKELSPVAVRRTEVHESELRNKAPSPLPA